MNHYSPGLLPRMRVPRACVLEGGVLSHGSPGDLHPRPSSFGQQRASGRVRHMPQGDRINIDAIVVVVVIDDTPPMPAAGGETPSTLPSGCCRRRGPHREVQRMGTRPTVWKGLTRAATTGSHRGVGVSSGGDRDLDPGWPRVGFRGPGGG